MRQNRVDISNKDQALDDLRITNRTVAQRVGLAELNSRQQTSFPNNITVNEKYTLLSSQEVT